MDHFVTMSEHTPSGLSTSRKRSYDGTILPHSQPDAHHINAGNSLPTPPIGTPSLGIAQDRGRQASPAISATSSSLTHLTDMTREDTKVLLSVAPTKKQKLTSAELESVRIAKKEGKETREKQKAEDKARREEEKRIKDEEKRRREEEKEVSRRQRELERSEKQKAKDAEKRAKEDQKRKKEEEKEKKERVRVIVQVWNCLLTIDSRKCELLLSSTSRKSLQHLHPVVWTMSLVAHRVDDHLS